MEGCTNCRYHRRPTDSYSECRHKSPVSSPHDATAWWPTLTERDREIGCGDFESADTPSEICGREQASLLKLADQIAEALFTGTYLHSQKVDRMLQISDGGADMGWW